MSERTQKEYLEEELAELIRLKAFLQKRIDRVRHKIRYIDQPKLNKGLKYDRKFWVPTNCLTPHVLQYLKTHSISELARDSGVAHKTITNIVDAETEFTSDTTAEAILLGMGLPHIYSQLQPVRLVKKLKQVDPPEPPESHYFEE